MSEWSHLPNAALIDWVIGDDLINPSDWIAVYNAGLALIAYDHAGALFDMPIEQVEVLAYLGQPAAVLLLPACRIRDKRRELIRE